MTKRSLLSYLNPFHRSYHGGGTLTDYSDFWYSVLNSNNANSNVNVTITSAMQLQSVYAAVSLVSSNLAAMPMILYQDINGTKRKATEHPLYNLLKNKPNSAMTAYNWGESRQAQVMTCGNNYAWIERSRLGVKGIWPLEPGNMEVCQKKRIVTYIYKQKNGKTRQYSSKDILHTAGLSFNGIVGESVITNFARSTIGVGISLEQFEELFFKNGMNPGGVFETDSKIKNETGFLKTIKGRFQGNKNAHLPMLLPPTMKFKSYDIKMCDAQFLDLTKANKIDIISGIFKVPPSKLGIFGANANKSNTEEQNRAYLENCLLPWIVRDEQSLNTTLLTDNERANGYFIKYNFDSILRPSAKDRAEIDHYNWQMGVPLNTMRARDDLNPVPYGDIGYVQAQNIPISQAGMQNINNGEGMGTESEPESETEEKSSNKQIEKRSLKTTLTQRDRIINRFSPLLLKEFKSITTLENNAITKKINKYRTHRNNQQLESYINKFYRELKPKMIKSLLPIYRSFGELINDQGLSELDLSENPKSYNLSELITRYLEGFTDQYTDSAKGQLTQQLDISLEALEERLTQWETGGPSGTTKPEKKSYAESNTFPNMIITTLIFSAGLRAVWRNRGASTCPYCKALNNRTISAGESFLDAGEYNPDGANNGPMQIKTTNYPQLHDKCDCVIVHA